MFRRRAKFITFETKSYACFFSYLTLSNTPLCTVDTCLFLSPVLYPLCLFELLLDDVQLALLLLEVDHAPVAVDLFVVVVVFLGG